MRAVLLLTMFCLSEAGGQMLFPGLFEMLSRTTNLPAQMALGYGNYCGYRVSGPGPPLDGYDRCCQFHDSCYRVSSRKACQLLTFLMPGLQYTQPYRFFTKGRHVTCLRGGVTSNCSFARCHCDRNLVNCLNAVKHPPNLKLLRNRRRG